MAVSLKLFILLSTFKTALSAFFQETNIPYGHHQQMVSSTKYIVIGAVSVQTSFTPPWSEQK